MDTPLIEYDDLNAEMPTHDRLMHLHITRCGGTAFDRILRGLRGYGLKPVGVVTAKHLNYGHLVEKYTTRKLPVPPAVTIIRNPWEWYVAFWSWVRVVDYNHFQGDLAKYIRMVSQKEYGACVSLSIYWETMQADMAQYVCRMENWREDIISAFTEIGIIPELVTTAQADKIISSVGIARHDREPNHDKKRTQWKGLRPYQEYYKDQESIDLVTEMDQELIERFGYDFETGLSFPWNSSVIAPHHRLQPR